MTETFFDYAEALERLDNDEEFLLELLNELVDQIDESLPDLKSAIEEKDHDSLRAVAHSIKGAAANLNVNEMAEVYFELEKLGRDGSTNGADSLLEQAIELNEKLREFLKNIPVS
jgi:HPt (histidine-containing phosphotransfer) domain-containing protein